MLVMKPEDQLWRSATALTGEELQIEMLLVKKRKI